MRKLAFALCLLTLCIATGMQAQTPTSTVSGIVKDSQGALVQGARVQITNTAQGTTRESVTNANGFYSIPDLIPGEYRGLVNAKGFATAQYAGVVLEAGRTFTLDAALTPATQVTTVNVTAAAQTVDLEQSMIQGQITENTIESIPLNGRNFLELAYLIPGNRPAPTFDPTKTNTLEISSAGGFGRGGNITIDGGDNNDEVVGGTLSNLPEDSIGEFQIATARFTAEVGRSGNSIINIISRSGTNSFHGSAFMFERNRNLQALPATFDAGQPKPPFDREQYGGSLGGPLAKDKLWWFSSAEYRDQNADIQTGTRNFATGAIEHTAAATPLRDLLLSNRLDYHLNGANSLSGRFSFNRSTDTAQASASSSTPLSTAAERQNSLNRFNSVEAAWTSVLSRSRTNELSFHYDNFYNNIPPYPQDASLTDPSLALGSELIFPDLADGANFNLPQTTFLNRSQLRDGLTMALGKHALKVGGEFQHYTAHGIINPFGNGTIFLTSDFGFADLNGDGVVNDLDIPVAVAIHSTAPVVPVPIPQVGDSYLAFFAQDDWRVRPNLTFTLGLRWEYDSDLTGTSSDHDPCPNLTSTPSQPCVWMANVIDLKKHPDTKDLGPRVGFTWDPYRHGKTVFRGGYGIYYDRIILETGAEERVQNDRALAVTQYAGSGCFSPDAPPYIPPLGQCFFPNASFLPGTPTLAAPFSGQHQTGGVGIIAMGPDSHHPLYQQFSLGFQQEAGSDWLASADVLHVFGERQLIGSLLRATDSTSPDISCPGNNVPCTITDPVTGISDNITLIQSGAKSWYDGLLVSLAHRESKIGKIGYQYNVSYTLSKTLDYSDDDQLTNNNADEQVNLAEGVSGLRKEKGYALTDELHRLTFYGDAQLPYGFSLAPIYTYGSGVPANTFLPSTAINGASGARLPLLPRNALGREVRNSKQLNALIDKWNALPACPGAYPCQAGGQIANVPANIDFSSPFSSFDLRLKKKFSFGERLSLSLIGEGFNLANQVNIRGSNTANFSGRNISIGPCEQTTPGSCQSNPAVQANFFSPASVAGGFFGSGGPRAFQFAARLEF
ncbi:MAG: TonB-dependent receptor [Terracidiphilus sp.]|nr:TonB-dependent receptor [Terracidiphilus sp.]